MIEHKRAAVYYAQHCGWAVFPLHWITENGQCSCGDADCRNAGKHPYGPLAPNGLINATTCVETIERWWTKVPQANIAIRTGGGLVVVDVDPRHGGDDNLRALESEHGELPLTPQVITGGGSHYYFKQHGFVKSSNGVLAPGIDVKGDGGYVVAPPSNHVSGRLYEWDVAFRLSTTPIAALPEWMASGKPGRINTAGGPPAAQLPAVWPEGERNKGLLRYGGLLRRDGVSEEGLEAELLAQNAKRCSPPLPENEVRRIVKSLMRPDYAPTASHGIAVLEQKPETGFAPFSDISNGHRLARDYGTDFRFVPEWGWLMWDGTRWDRDAMGRIHLKAEQVVRGMRAEAEAITDAELRSKVMKRVASCENVQRLSAMVAVAARQPGIARLAKDFDTYKWHLNCLNGVVDLKTGTLAPHDPAMMITKVVPFVYDPEATCPRWRQFLFEVFAEDCELVSYVQRCLGYSLAAVNSEDCMFIMHGSGRNGKSTLVNTIRNVLGPDYTRECDPKLLLDRKPDSPSNDIARLRGARFVTARETEEGGKRLAASLVKAMTGRDTLVARFLNHEFFEFRPEFTLFLATNHEPRITDTSPAMWARIRKIPFTVTFPPERQDKELEEKLLQEAPGILAWLVAGCLEWQAMGGLGEPRAIVEATEAYRADQDPVGRFLAEETVEDPMAEEFIGVAEAYERYCKWSEGDGREPFSRDWFARKVRERGYKSVKRPGSGRDSRAREYEPLVWRSAGK